MTSCDRTQGSKPRGAGWIKRLQAALLADHNNPYEQTIAVRKRQLFAGLRGTVLEIGPGTGPNLQFYPPGIHWIGVEPNPYMHSHLRSTAERLGMQIDIVNGTAEHLDVADNSVDVVVTTLVLCSVRDPEAALGEIVRVLKPGGRFIFIEHVAASRGTLTHWTQWAVGPAWKVVADGCRPTRETWRVIEQAGFGHVALEHFRLPWPIVGPHIAGVATK